MKQTILIIGLLFCVSCSNENEQTPKPRMYPRIDLPAKTYTNFEQGSCPFQFLKPDYTEVVKEKLFFDEQPQSPCWFDLKSSHLKTNIHFSYYPIGEIMAFDALVNDAFKMAGKHDVKADYIDESIISNANGAGGILFELSGPVASPIQFFLTDSTDHFLRGSLYFNSTVNRDSIKPVYEFVRNDILKMIETFRFN